MTVSKVALRISSRSSTKKASVSACVTVVLSALSTPSSRLLIFGSTLWRWSEPSLYSYLLGGTSVSASLTVTFPLHFSFVLMACQTHYKVIFLFNSLAVLGFLILSWFPWFFFWFSLVSQSAFPPCLWPSIVPAVLLFCSLLYGRHFYIRDICRPSSFPRLACLPFPSHWLSFHFHVNFF